MLTSSTKREVRYFHVVVVQWRQRSVQQSMMHKQSCCFANLNLLLFCRSRWRRRRRCSSSLLILYQENALQPFLAVVTLWLKGYKTVLHTMHKTNKSAFWQATMFVNYFSKNWISGSYWVFLLLHPAVTGTSQKLKPEPSAGKGPLCYQATISWFVPIHPIHLNKGNSQFGYCWETAIGSYWISSHPALLSSSCL